MRIFLTGVACVGKTTIGKDLSALLGYAFFDLDAEVEQFYGKPIPRLQSECLTMSIYREKAAAVLKRLLQQTADQDCVIALPPSGLMDGCWRVLRKGWGPVAVLSDTPKNILAKITFYDDDSRRIEKTLTDMEKKHYLSEIKKDIAYFRRSYRRADFIIDIAGLGPAESAAKLARHLGLTHET